jgi:hypothetical protein
LFEQRLKIQSGSLCIRREFNAPEEEEEEKQGRSQRTMEKHKKLEDRTENNIDCIEPLVVD